MIADMAGRYFCVDLPGWFGWNIRHFTHSEFNHCGVILDDQGTILEAQPRGAVIDNISKYDQCLKAYSPDRIIVPSGYLSAAAKGWVGIPYGFPDIVLLALKLTVHHTPKLVTDYVLSEHRMICSQLVASFAGDFGVDWKCGQSHEQYVTPGMLANRC